MSPPTHGAPGRANGVGERHDTRRKTAVSTSHVLLLLVAFRTANALATSTFFQPDEYFQSLEPAWQLAFGNGSGAWITWVTLRLSRCSSCLLQAHQYCRTGGASCARRFIRASLPQCTLLLRQLLKHATSRSPCAPSSWSTHQRLRRRCLQRAWIIPPGDSLREFTEEAAILLGPLCVAARRTRIATFVLNANVNDCSWH